MIKKIRENIRKWVNSQKGKTNIEVMVFFIATYLISSVFKIVGLVENFEFLVLVVLMLEILFEVKLNKTVSEKELRGGENNG